MSDRPGTCPVCNKPFKDGDDVVICPDCGAPYHRECYKQAGACVYSDKHAAGFEYVPPRAEPEAAAPGQGQPDGGQAAGGQAWSAGPQTNTGGILCKNCHTVNDATNIFCEKCGYPLRSVEAAGQAGGWRQPPPGQTPPPNGPGGPYPGGGAGAPGYNPVYGGVDFSGEIDGISKRDWAEFIGAAAPTYLTRMGQMARRNGKISFMFSAFLCPQYYFAYRKMWLWAILGLVIDLAVYFVNVIQQVAQAGFMVFTWLSPETLYMVYDVIALLVLGIRIASGLFALYLYKQDAAKKIVAISADFGTTPVYHEELRKKGGVSILGVVLCVVLFMVFNYAVVAFIGADAVNALYAYMNDLMAGLAI